MNKQRVKELALSNGFKLKEQPGGVEDLNPYVYEFAAALVETVVAERDALVAQVEALREAWEAVKSNDWDAPLDEAFSTTPQQHLAELRAEAVERAIGLYTHKLGSDAKLNEVGIDIIKKYGEYIHPDGLREYVNQLRSRTDGEYSDSIRQGKK